MSESGSQSNVSDFLQSEASLWAFSYLIAVIRYLMSGRHVICGFPLFTVRRRPADFIWQLVCSVAQEPCWTLGPVINVLPIRNMHTSTE